MILSNASILFEQSEPTTACSRGGVWKLADVLPELLARYDVSADKRHEQGWIDVSDEDVSNEAVVCSAG